MKNNLQRTSIGDWTILSSIGLPELYESYKTNAEFVDEIDLKISDGSIYFVGISQLDKCTGWPKFVISQRYSPDISGFSPAALIVPQTNLLFLGAGERLLCYDLYSQERLWEDETSCGFWAWNRFDDFVIMSAEIEFAVWTITGIKLWSVFVEPPWSFEICDRTVSLDVMGKTRKHKLEDGTPCKTIRSSLKNILSSKA